MPPWFQGAISEDGSEGPDLAAVVLDATSFFDLQKGEILGCIYFLRNVHSFFTTDLIEEELKSVDAVFMAKLGLVVYALDANDMTIVGEYSAKYTGPSTQDLSALLLARKTGAILITRDGLLQDAANNEGVNWDHSIWVIEQMVIEKSLTSEEAVDAVKTIVQRRPRFKDGLKPERVRGLTWL